MVKTYDMTTGYIISEPMEQYTSIHAGPVQASEAVAHPTLALQLVQSDARPQALKCPHDLAQMPVGDFLRRQR